MTDQATLWLTRTSGRNVSVISVSIMHFVKHMVSRNEILIQSRSHSIYSKELIFLLKIQPTEKSKIFMQRNHEITDQI